MKKVRKKFTTWCAKRKSLRWSMVSMLLFGWFFPLLLMIFIMIFLVTNNISRQMEHTITTSAGKAADILKLHLEDCEAASKNASYMQVVAKSYNAYLKDGNEDNFNNGIEDFMKQQYQYNANCKAAILVFLQDSDKLHYAYNNRNNGTYSNIEFFQKNALDEILEVSKELDTATVILRIDGRVYMVRNLVDPKFHPYAVLSLELDQDYLMKSLAGIWGYVDACVYLNEEILMPGIEGTDTEILQEDIVKKLKAHDMVYDHRKGAYSYVYRKIKMAYGNLELVAQLDNSVTQAEMRTLWYFFLILILFVILLVIQVLRFFHKKVTEPIETMITASDAVKEGRLGTQIAHKADSEEFYHMQDAFDHMSLKLKEQFDKIYLEEIALRDAKIMELQAQINPHFLNNTLEIINWEARLNENYKVSGMIEALSTMLEATMNRKAQQFNSIAEEMAYVDAYLYIISQRFGEKFKCSKKIDESLLDVRIPRLIIQPIVENAVEHGMDIARQGQIEIRLYRNGGGYLCIEVEDNGHLTPQEREKIDKLLSKEPDPEQERRVSLGIRNVDQRLKMIYGMSCGLFIASNRKNHTVSTILIKIDPKTEQ